MPPRGTGAATKRSGKHENGLVVPTGKRLQKKRSNGHVNGNGNLKPSLASNRDSSQSSTPLSTPSTPPPKNGNVPNQADYISEPKMATIVGRRTSLSAYSESSSSDSYRPLPAIDISSLENHRQIDVNAAKNPNVHRDLGPLTLVYTVLKSCPLSDTIAILIVLLQLPPTVLSVIHLLFATLTFVPPSSTAGYSTFGFADIFEGSLGTPSLATILVVDMLVLLTWVFLWSPLQDIALDLAQTVIAMTLGGGVSGKEKGTGNALACLGVIGLGHLARNGRIKPSGLRLLLSATPHVHSPSDTDLALTESIPRSSDKSYPGLFGSILAIHILTQGVVRYIRDWYVRRERRDTAVASLGDPEAANGSLTDSAHDSTSAASNADITNASLPIINNPEKILSAKKKRKQSAQVRTWQPLWAALASTKVVMVKEYEASHTAAESAGTNATDINNLGNAPFNTEADRIWIAYVGFDEVSFNTSYFPSHLSPEACSEREEFGPPGVDQSKPFFVRVNNTVWQPTRINKAKEEGSGNATRWSGEIFGLAPMSSYKCEFVSTVTGEIIFSSSVKTLQAPSSEAAAVASLSPGPQRSLRPDSPTTTLKTSIATSEVKLAEERNRQKRERKDQKTRLNNSRKEMERLTNSITTSGGNDDRLRQKAQQSNVHKKQAEDLIAETISELENLSALPQDHADEWKSTKQIWQAEKEVQKRSRSDLHTAKQSAEREFQSITNEVTNLQQKREKLQGRLSKLNGEHERITDANAKGLDEVQRKATERAAVEAERLRSELMYAERINMAVPQIHDMTENLNALYSNYAALQAEQYLASQAVQQSPTPSMQHLNGNGYDPTFDNSSYPWNPSINANLAPPPPYAEMPNTTSSPAMGLQEARHRRRVRRSSMLSNQSGFTQESDDELPLPREAQESIDQERQKSDGSTESGSVGSVGDPKSPLIGKSRWVDEK